MRLILQRVCSASVMVSDERIAKIDRGILALVGVEKGDGVAQALRVAEKLSKLRIFQDEDGRMNLDIAAVSGSVLLVSQFTLAASLGKGRRPSFDNAAPAAVAKVLVEKLAMELKGLDLPVATGRFGAHMRVELVNDGPVTFVLDVPPSDPAKGHDQDL